MMMMIETKIMIGTLGSKVRFTNIRQQGSNNYYDSRWSWIWTKTNAKKKAF